jgi:hypothetical protein
MSNATQGLLQMTKKDQPDIGPKEVVQFPTLNFSVIPGTSRLIIIEKPRAQKLKMVDRDGKEHEVINGKPPVQRIIDLDLYEDVCFVSDTHMDAEEQMLREQCEKLNIDYDAYISSLTP